MPTPRHLELLLRLHPRGPYDLDEDALPYEDLSVLASGLDLADDQRLELLDEVLPDRTEDLLTSWERVYDIHRVSGRTVLQRRRAVLARRRLLPDFKRSTIESILETLTEVDVTVTEPLPFRCDDASSLCDGSGGTYVLDGAFVFFADLDQAQATAAGVDRDALDEMIDHVKPAHIVGLSRFDGFCCDDALSLCDRDLLGA